MARRHCRGFGGQRQGAWIVVPLFPPGHLTPSSTRSSPSSDSPPHRRPSHPRGCTRTTSCSKTRSNKLSPSIRPQNHPAHVQTDTGTHGPRHEHQLTHDRTTIAGRMTARPSLRRANAGFHGRRASNTPPTHLQHTSTPPQSPHSVTSLTNAFSQQDTSLYDQKRR